MTSPTLLSYIREYKINGQPSQFLENEYWMRWILAIVPLLFTLCAIPIGIMAGKGGKAIGFGVSLIIMFTYYLILIFSINASEKQYAPPYVLMWLPNIVTALCGIFLYKKMLKK